MPALLQQVHCNHCRQTRSVIEMSIFNGICNGCFDTAYRLCADCGALLRRSNSRNRTFYPPGGFGYEVEGEFYCCNCYGYHTGDCDDRYWPTKPFNVSIATYQRIGSKRKYGVEIETSSCRLREELRQLTHFGCKSDPTVHGAEFDSPILYGDEGFEHIKDFLTFAEARRWGVNSTCGCHTHYDMRDESEEKLYRIACAYRWTYKMWKRCVSRRRRDNSYCRPPVCSISEIVRNLTSGTVFAQFACNRDRYEYFNLYAYQCHKTFEIRLLEGTLDPDVICNWIAVHCRFMDCVRNLTIAELRDTFDCTARRQYRAISSMIGDDSLMDWVADRARYTGRFPVRGPDCSRS